MQGPFYHDTIQPFVQADESAVTLTTTNKALLPAARYNGLGTQFFNQVGRRLRVRAFGKMTTSTSPGTLTLAFQWGTGADNNGTNIMASAAQTLIASQTNISWELDCTIHCRTIGSSGSLFGVGKAQFGTALIAAGTFLIPASAAAATGSLDLTGTNIPSLQALVSSGSSITMTVQDFELDAMN